MPEAAAGTLLVAVGAAIGAPLRFFVSGFVARRVGETFPWGTMAVNVSGAFVIGAVAALAQARGAPAASSAWLFVVTGVLGSYTTVSSFSLHTLALARDGERRQALVNMGLTPLLCLSAVALGYGAAGLAVR